MKILLDTHVLIWALEDSPRLPESIKNKICDPQNQIYVSAVSLWEIALKHKKYPESFPFSANEIRNYCQRCSFIFLSISVDNISFFDKNDFSLHKDPFDQMLVSQSASNNMMLLTHDIQLLKYKMGFVEYF